MDVVLAIAASSAALLTVVDMQGTAGEVQSAVLLTWHPCSAAATQDCIRYVDWAIAPAAFGPTEAPELFGSFTVIGGFCVAHMIITCIVKVAQGAMSSSLRDSERWDIAAAKCMFPNLSLMVIAFFYQGVMYFTFQNYFKGSNSGYGLGISFATSGFTIMLVGLTMYWALTRCKCEYLLLRSGDSAAARASQAATSCLHTVARPSACWKGGPHILRMGAVFYPYRRPRVWFAIIPWVRTFGIGLATAALSKRCAALFIVVIGIWFCSGLFTLIMRPFRSRLQFSCSMLGHLISIICCVTGVANAALPCPVYLVALIVWNIVAVLLTASAIYELLVIVREEDVQAAAAALLAPARPTIPIRPSNPMLQYL